MRTRVAPSVSAAACVLVTLAVVAGVTACNDDGRVLRPSRADQTGTVSVPSTSTIAADGFVDAGFDQGLDGAGDGAGEEGVEEGVEETVEGSFPAATDAAAPVLTAAFAEGAVIGQRFTCDGENVSPPLGWTAAPTGTIEIAITMTDLDAPGFVHWAMAGIDPLSTALGEGVVPEFAIVGLNGTGAAAYTGPCPPSGTHRYQFTVHFLAQQTELSDGTAGADLLAAIDGATFAFASVTGTYSRG